jgi:outer membrane usher protein
VAVSGTLEDARGESVVLQAGEAHSLAQPQRPPVLLFTNRSGQFRADGFKPGEYELRMFYHSEARLRFAIPKDAAGAHELGTLRLPAAAPRIMSR